MKNTKLLLLTVLVLSLCMSLAACSRSGSSAAATQTRPPKSDQPAVQTRPEEETYAWPHAGDDETLGSETQEPAANLPKLDYSQISIASARPFSEGIMSFPRRNGSP